jgi:phospholipase/carboxylesterase
MAPATDLNHIRKFVPAHPDSSHPVTLVLLHLTGGDENSLLSLGNQLWLGAALLGLRAKVLENGMPPSFRRFTEPGLVNVRSGTEELAQFIGAAFERYGFSERMVVAYSNGANLPASLILLPHFLAGAVLFPSDGAFVAGSDSGLQPSFGVHWCGAPRPIIPSGQAEEPAGLVAGLARQRENIEKAICVQSMTYRPDQRPRRRSADAFICKDKDFQHVI